MVWLKSVCDGVNQADGITVGGRTWKKSFKVIEGSGNLKENRGKISGTSRKNQWKFNHNLEKNNLKKFEFQKSVAKNSKLKFFNLLL